MFSLKRCQWIILSKVLANLSQNKVAAPLPQLPPSHKKEKPLKASFCKRIRFYFLHYPPTEYQSDDTTKKRFFHFSGLNIMYR